jgi:hydrogenase-4 component B
VIRLGSLAQLAALGLAGADAVQVLLSGGALRWTVPSSGPLGPRLVALDPLAAVFVVALVLVGGSVAIYAPGYVEKAGHRMSGRTQQALLCLLEASILGVLAAGDVLGFFIGWELMTAIATALALADGHRPEVKRAGVLYIVITHVGTFAALTGILLLATGASDGSFAAVRAAAAEMPPGLRGAAIVLAIAGFVTKAGVVPLHVWLPEAHPVAPSHVSAVLSGVIIKVGVYAMLRTVLDLVAPAPTWVGYAILVIGLTSALLGVLYALMQHDLKRLLAFHSVENIGIILLGAGLAIVARDAGMPALASVALAAGLFHVVNHAVFKALLFLCAGSVHLGTHTRDLEEMGGLMKRMPSTARAFLIGALAISALPPLNGFASEWMILQGFFGAKDAMSPLLRATSPLFAAGLALTGALAAACFVKAFAVAFLALPRSPHAEHAHEVAPSLRAAQTFLAVVCVVLGLASPAVARLLASAAHATDAALPTLEGNSALSAPGIASVQPLVIAGIGVALVLCGVWYLRRRARPRRAMTWACGLGSVEGRAAYTASAFANPIKRIFSNLYRFERDVEPVEGEPPYFVRRSRTRGSIAPLFERYLYQPVLRLLHRLAEWLAPWSSPTVNRGLALFALVLGLLVWWVVQ